jgi:hypothetical protein
MFVKVVQENSDLGLAWTNMLTIIINGFFVAGVILNSWEKLII